MNLKINLKFKFKKEIETTTTTTTATTTETISNPIFPLFIRNLVVNEGLISYEEVGVFLKLRLL